MTGRSLVVPADRHRGGRPAKRRNRDPRKCDVCGGGGGRARETLALPPTVAAWLAFVCPSCVDRFSA